MNQWKSQQEERVQKLKQSKKAARAELQPATDTPLATFIWGFRSAEARRTYVGRVMRAVLEGYNRWVARRHQDPQKPLGNRAQTGIQEASSVRYQRDASKIIKYADILEMSDAETQERVYRAINSLYAKQAQGDEDDAEVAPSSSSSSAGSGNGSSNPSTRSALLTQALAAAAAVGPDEDEAILWHQTALEHISEVGFAIAMDLEINQEVQDKFDAMRACLVNVLKQFRIALARTRTAVVFSQAALDVLQPLSPAPVQQRVEALCQMILEDDLGYLDE